MIPDDLAREIEAAARDQNQSPEQLLWQMWHLYQASLADAPTTPDAVRQRVYARARAYWSAYQMTDRMQLTDEALDEQFAFIDAQGIPRLHGDGVDRPGTPLDDLLGTLDTPATDLSTTTRETLRQFFRNRT